MKVTVFLLLATMVFSYVALATDQYDVCCFCLQDPQDSIYTRKECERWVKQSAPALGCQRTQTSPNYQQVRVEGQYRCNKVNVYGAFHGLSSMVHIPAQIADNLTYDLKPRELNYDGSSCLLFNNVDQGREQAKTLSQRYPWVKFNLKGNQNSGITEMLAFIGNPHELPEATSKVSFIAEGGTVTLRYDACTPQKKTCYFTTEDQDATNDSNLKYCMSGGQVVTQRCCRSARGPGEGKWSAPGRTCAR